MKKKKVKMNGAESDGGDERREMKSYERNECLFQFSPKTCHISLLTWIKTYHIDI